MHFEKRSRVSGPSPRYEPRLLRSAYLTDQIPSCAHHPIFSAASAANTRAHPACSCAGASASAAAPEPRTIRSRRSLHRPSAAILQVPSRSCSCMLDLCRLSPPPRRASEAVEEKGMLSSTAAQSATTRVYSGSRWSTVDLLLAAPSQSNPPSQEALGLLPVSMWTKPFTSADALRLGGSFDLDGYGRRSQARALRDCETGARGDVSIDQTHFPSF